ncbi:hybrid signal transduction histidine [Chrysochromulina tobinii]|uniref:histidine kinase n=1 Tax=Chrysochromulina tobinii TaxID=1460289 RepID=A0A0M0JL35_9EUKA|nr:hybrid signal transduction histidine [Chrysochromulina tobinii]|eukprot:KOO27022.1 hybrid signal transduction histidine [Chrysochromulina sp. CCMP291]
MEADKNKPHLSRAAAAAHRRLSASEARRKPASEVMLVSSKSFPSQQYQELLTFIKGLQLPPDVTLLFTTVPNERVAERKAALAAQSSEHVDDMLQAAGSKLALLSQLKSDLGLSGTPTPMSSFGSSFDAPLGSPPPLPTLPPTSKVSVYEAYSQEMSTPPVPAARTKGTGGGTATGSGEGGGRLGSGSGSTTDAPPGSKSSSPPSQPLAGHVGASPQRVTLTETHFGTGSNSGGAGFAINLDALPAPAFVCDATGVVHGWNAAIQQLTGWPVDAVRGKRLVDVLVPEDTRKHVHDCLVRSRAADSAVRLQTADGRLLDLQVRLSNFALPPSAETSDAAAASSSVSSVGAAGIAGTSLPREGVLAVGVDVTSLLGRAAAASQEVHDLKRLIDCANAPIFGINAMSLITEWNRKATQITGRTKWEVVGRRLEDFIQPEDRASVVEVLDNALRGKETANFEFPLYTKSKERVEILLNAATRRDANNEIVGVVGVGQDITELNRGKAELGRVANDLKILIESANAPILGVDTSGCINEWNKKAAELTGYTAQEMKGCQLVEAGPVKEEFKASVRQVLTHAMNGIDSTNFELPLYARNGQRVELSLNATTRHSAKGEVVGVVMVGQDITGKKDVEKAQIAAAKARAASDAKGTFMASMSHEMRTPLNGVLGMLQLALELDLPPKGLKYAQNAMMSAQHLMNLVNDILDISKIEAGKLELEQRVFNVHEVLHAAVEIVKVNALNKRVRIEIDIDDSLPVFVVGDQQRLRQVLLNLLFNAVKFTPQGRIVVTAARQAEFANHLRLQMAVEDTGIGIREEDIRHLFGLFSKIRDKRVENPLGVGLGLAICKQLVELMRGQIHVVSEYGRGTKFFFNLLVGKAGSPQIEAHQRQAAEQRASTELISVDMVGKNVGRVLVVEDNEFNIEVVRCMLDNAGHTVGMAMNGVEGIEAWQAARERGEPYDAVLMDCNMPLMDGYEATRRIRAKLAEEAEVTGQRTTETLPIIALTAYAMPGDKEKCLNAGMSDYITKPVNRDVLISTVLKHMRLHWHHEKERALETKQRGGASMTPERQRPVLERPSGGYAGVAGRGVDQQRCANSLPSTSRALTLAGSNGKGGRAMDSHVDERRKSKASEKANASGGGSGDGARPSASAGLEDVAHVDEPFNRSAALDNYQGPGGELLLSRMEEEFVAKSGVLRGEMMVERMQVLATKGDYKAIKREAGRMEDTATKLGNVQLKQLSRELAEAAGRANGEDIHRILDVVQQRLNIIMNYSVRGMLVYNTLTELSEDLRLAARSDAATAHKLLLKATSEFGQLSDYLAGLRHLPLPGGTDDAAHAPAAESEPAASASPAAEPEASDALQCKSVVASCVHNGKEMLEAMVRELLHGTLHHTAACRLVADTFLAVVGDLGQAAESDQMAVVSERIERVNSQFFHISDLIARNKMVTGKGPTHPTSPATPQQHKLSGGKFGAVDVHASDEWWLLNTRRRRAASVETPVVDEQQALRQFGGDLSFLRQMCAKFVASGRGVIERIQGLIEALSLGAASTTPMQDRYTELRRVAHSLKGAASTIGAMRLSQEALDLQLAAESESAISSLNDLSQQVLLQFEMVCAAIDPESGELDASKVEGPTRLVPSVPEPPAPAKDEMKAQSAVVRSFL